MLEGMRRLWWKRREKRKSDLRQQEMEGKGQNAAGWAQERFQDTTGHQKEECSMACSEGYAALVGAEQA